MRAVCVDKYAPTARYYQVSTVIVLYYTVCKWQV